jgi:hypothetical protein
MTVQQKITNFAARELERTKEHLILSNGAGSYIVFGSYLLEPDEQEYKVFNLSEDLVGTFSNKKSAMSWCVADKFNRLNLANNIKNLDEKKRSLGYHISTRQQAYSGAKSLPYAETVSVKMSIKILKYKSVCNELEKCINLAKYLQIKGFQNATERHRNV